VTLTIQAWIALSLNSNLKLFLVQKNGSGIMVRKNGNHVMMERIMIMKIKGEFSHPGYGYVQHCHFFTNEEDAAIIDWVRSLGVGVWGLAIGWA
jgi:hypothetical protein